jgi:hypothetical protein
MDIAEISGKNVRMFWDMPVTEEICSGLDER